MNLKTYACERCQQRENLNAITETNLVCLHEIHPDAFNSFKHNTLGDKRACGKQRGQRYELPDSIRVKGKKFVV